MDKLSQKAYFTDEIYNIECILTEELTFSRINGSLFFVENLVNLNI